MNERLLDDIIALEKSLQAQVDAEEERSRAWRDHELDKLAEEERALQQTLETDFAAALEQVRKDADAEADRPRADTEATCRRLSELSDTALREALRTVLTRILPEAGHDHADGQS